MKEVYAIVSDTEFSRNGNLVIDTELAPLFLTADLAREFMLNCDTSHLYSIVAIRVEE